MTFPILYSLTTRNQTQTWQIETKGPRFRTTEGLDGGILTTSKWTLCRGKNKGRSNETTATEQAEREAKSRHQRKIDSGYHETKGAISQSRFFEPMLAKSYDDYPIEIWPVYSQPKLDGCRCIISQDGMFSRNGKPIVSASHIFETIKHVFETQPNMIFDGELYNHSLKDDFNQVISLAKKTVPTADDLAASAATLEYWIYDLHDGTRPELIFAERSSLLAYILPSRAPIVIVPTCRCETLHDLDTLYDQYLIDGYEGQMVRANTSYENKRTKNLLKRKTFQDGEFILVDLEAGRGNAAKHAARAILKTADGVTFEAGIIGSHPYCAAILRDKSQFVGKMATVVYQNMTPGDKPVPRFGKLKQLDRTDV